MLVSSVHRFVRARALFSAVVLVSLALVSGCSSGSSSSKVAAPSNLVYPAATINATPGQPIATATPTVTGGVTSYSITPALPAGLTLDSSTGVISGTPTASSPQTTYTVTASNAGGTTSTTVQIAVVLPPPSALSYPQATITVTQGQAIAADTPAVTGTVASYAVAPALPAGLSINATTGVISGTPTAVAAQASYTVTATNASGSTTATLQITVNAPVPPPSALRYPQSAIVAMVNQPVIPDIPAVQGTVTSFTVSPSLPAGLSLDSATGTISGTPTQITAQASYTVTASNAGGSTTSTVSITVNKGYQTLLDLGHGLSVRDMQSIAGRLLSRDAARHWVLWDTTSDTKIADGDQPMRAIGTSDVWPVAMAGSTLAIGQINGVEIRSATDGHRIAIIASPSFIDIDPSNGLINAWWKLSSDGTYLCAGSPSGLNVWSANGQLLFSRQGDYSSAVAFAAPNQIQIASGAAGKNVIETIAVPGGAASVGPTFLGTFNSWFLDGQRFLTNTGTTVWVYSNASVQQAIVSLPNLVSPLVGQGNWISAYSYYGLQIFAIGANTPSATYNTGSAGVPSGLTLGIFSPDGTGSIIDLSGATPSQTKFTTPIVNPSGYTANSASQWFIANQHGRILDGATLSTTPTFFNSGRAWSIAGSTNRVAVALANGQIDSFGAGMLTLEGTVDFPSSKVQLSSDGSVLAAAANAIDGPYQRDRTLRFYSLPAGTLNTSIPYTYPLYGPGSGINLVDFSLSGSGTVLGQTLSGTAATLQVGPVGSAPTWTSPGQQLHPPPPTNFVRMSPDGTSWAVSDGTTGYTMPTNIYKNGVLTTTVPGWFVGWIDNNRFLVNVYANNPTGAVYLNALICDTTGATLATLSLPELHQIQSLGSELIYSIDQNAIYSLSTGQPVWSQPIPSNTNVSNQGGVAGSYVVFAYGSKILVDTY